MEPGGVLLVHTSFRAIGPVEGGPQGFIDALTRALGPEGTLVMPSWSDRPEPYDPRTSPVARSLGVVARAFAAGSAVLRSDHPHAFAARGPRAPWILRDPLPLPPHIPESPVGRVHELDGQVLLAGVDHTADTTVHLAELLAGVPYRVPKRCRVLRNGRAVTVEYGENDHCCARFAWVGEWLDAVGAQARGPLGHGVGTLVRSRSVVEVVVPRLLEDPLLFLHPPEARCPDCDEARASVGDGPRPAGAPP